MRVIYLLTILLLAIGFLSFKKSDEKLIHNFANDIGFNQEKIRTGEAKRNDTITQYVELRS